MTKKVHTYQIVCCLCVINTSKDVDSFMGSMIEFGVLCGSPLQMLGQSITQIHQPLLDISQNTGRVSDTLKNEFNSSIF